MGVFSSKSSDDNGNVQGTQKHIGNGNLRRTV